MKSSDRNIVKEAVADARHVKELAVEAAKQKLVEEMSPAIKNIVERHIMSSVGRADEGVNRMRQAAGGYDGITDFEEGKDLEGDKEMDDKKDKKDKDLEKESLESMFPGLHEMEDDEELDAVPEMGMSAGDDDDREMEYAGGRPGVQIPTLGEKCAEEEQEEEEGDMDEEISIDEEGLRRAYENVMKSAKAIDEAQVTSGFSDTYPKSEWETEESPPSDRGLEDKEKDPAEWDKERPKASQDYQVKEAIEKGLKENQELARYVSYLEEQHANAITVIKQLNRQIHEVNLFNRKMLKVNEMLNKFSKNLTNEQKKLVISKIDEASDTKQVDLVAEALKAAFGSSIGLNEGKRRSNKPNAQRRITSGAPDQKVLRESVDKSGMRDQFARQRELAGLVS